MPLNSTDIPGLYCVGDSTFPGQGVNAVVFSGFGCAHRALCDLGLVPSWPLVDNGFRSMLRAAREAASRLGMTERDRAVEEELAEAAAAAAGLAAELAEEEERAVKERRHRQLLQSRTTYPYIEAGALLSNIVPLNVVARKAREVLTRSSKQ